MAKRNWFENIEDEGHNAKKKALARNENSLMSFDDLLRHLFGNHPFEIENVDVRVPGTFDDFVKSFNDSGFKDKGDSYEFVTNLGGQRCRYDAADEDSVKVEFNGDDNRMITVNYSYATSNGVKKFYSHTQSTSATLPDDADEDTVTAHIDEGNNVVVTAKKKAPKKDDGGNLRSIPVSRK